MEYILEVSNLLKRIEKFQIENINLKLEPGYIMGLIGANGSGKTTLILTLLGLYKPMEGKITICGYDMAKQEKQAKDCIGFVLDDNPFPETLSAMDNAKMYGRYYSNWDSGTFDFYCKHFEVDRKRPLRKLSMGNRMKFQLAFALSHDARLLILDEPTAGLDPVFRRELLEIMSEIISDGERSILYSTHLTEELDKLADYITFIQNGKQLFSLSKEELLERYGLLRGSLKQLMDVDERIIVGKRIGDNLSEALIRKDIIPLSKDLQLQKPTIEDIMFYTVQSL